MLPRAPRSPSRTRGSSGAVLLCWPLQTALQLVPLVPWQFAVHPSLLLLVPLHRYLDVDLLQEGYDASQVGLAHLLARYADEPLPLQNLQPGFARGPEPAEHLREE